MECGFFCETHIKKKNKKNLLLMVILYALNGLYIKKIAIIIH